MPSPRTALFLAALAALRAHPGWDDADVAASIGARPPEHDLIAEARRQLAAGG